MDVGRGTISVLCTYQKVSIQASIIILEQETPELLQDEHRITTIVCA